MSLDPLQSLALAAAILLVGRALNRRVGVLARYNIPQPITGGLAFALLATLLHATTGFAFEVSVALRGPLLLAFFATVGLAADLGRLKAGGPKLVIFLLVVGPYLALQNIVGTALALLLDQHPLMGLLGGSITLVGGHGTGAAYARIFTETHELTGAAEVAMAAATVGLVAGGVLAGPVAQYLLRRTGTRDAVGPGETAAGAAVPAPVSTDAAVVTVALIAFCIVAGSALAAATAAWPIRLPDFVWCLFCGVLVRNLIAPAVGLPVDDGAIDLLGGIALALFLAMAMSAVQLWELADLAGPLMLILAAQAALAAVYAAVVVWRVMGRNYEAVVISAGFYGFALGATATAIANMQAVVGRHGPAPVAFLVVPLTGAFFIDLMNAVLLSGALSLPLFAP
ncbi:sodium/glutamate symporter [Falsiroseomonas sp. HW251]|uniref:sodium/glutamate symporter n=1 Tax=Falsiroseomonas sp. HW251 TaxID=3390998 RepID=UPI003D3211A6